MSEKNTTNVDSKELAEVLVSTWETNENEIKVPPVGKRNNRITAEEQEEQFEGKEVVIIAVELNTPEQEASRKARKRSSTKKETKGTEVAE